MIIFYPEIPQQNYNDMTLRGKTEYALPPLREKVDQYSYLSKQSIGKGYSSSVYKGKDDRTDEQVAIKVIDMKNMKGQIYKTLLAAEIQILSLIKNKPNLLDVHKIHADKNKTYIITDYCQGGDLSKFIKSRKKVPEHEAIKIIKQIIRGYQSLYELGIVHRDLKPANIFFHNSKSQIGDFGFAIKQEKLKLSERYNVGSPVYMPPEALNSNKYSHKSDIWAIGVIFYEMLTGTTPWTGRTQTQLKAKLKTISIRNIMPPSLSPVSNTFLKRALDADPKKRMQPNQMFDHFYISHDNQHQGDEVSTNQRSNILFRSMRKPVKYSNFQQTKGESLKKTTNQIVNKKAKHEFLQTVNPNQYGQIPKTAIQTKIQKEYLPAIHKRAISKQLLSQVHFCRFLYKIIGNVDLGISYEFNEDVRKQLVTLLFYKLSEISSLKLLPHDVLDQYKQFGDYKKLEKLVEEYQLKYKKRLRIAGDIHIPDFYSKQLYEMLAINLNSEIVNLYNWISYRGRQPNFLIKQIVILDYMITLSQLLEIMAQQNINDFHTKSKIQAIVDGEPLEEVSIEHVKLIKNKLKALKILVE